MEIPGSARFGRNVMGLFTKVNFGISTGTPRVVVSVRSCWGGRVFVCFFLGGFLGVRF